MGDGPPTVGMKVKGLGDAMIDLPTYSCSDALWSPQFLYLIAQLPRVSTKKKKKKNTKNLLPITDLTLDSLKLTSLMPLSTISRLKTTSLM
jgi:hypothetical protein